MTAAEKREAVARGGLQATRRGLPPGVDLAEALDLRIESLEQIAAFRQQLLREIRAKAWSHLDAALQVQLLVDARQSAVALEKLKHARAVLTRGPGTAHLHITLQKPWAGEVATPPRHSLPRAIEATLIAVAKGPQ